MCFQAENKQSPCISDLSKNRFLTEMNQKDTTRIIQNAKSEVYRFLCIVLLAAIAIIRGIDLHCGCFGGKGTTAWNVALRNTAILAILGTIRLITTRYFPSHKF